MFPLPALVYKSLGVAFVFLAYTGFVYWRGGEAPRAELAQLQSDIRAAQKMHEAEDAKREAESKAIITEKDADHEKAVRAINRSWAAYAERMRQPAGTGISLSHAQPIPFPAGLCNDPAEGQIISAAIQRYRFRLAQSVDQYRLGVAGILEQAEINTAQLVNLQDAIAKLREVNE